MKVVFRVDASIQIGTGHVSRCLALATRLKNSGAQCCFVMRRLEGNMIAAVEAMGIPVIALDPPDTGQCSGDLAHSEWLGVDWSVDSNETAAALVPLGTVNWLVVDHYALDVRWESVLRESTENIMVIDDLADRRHDCEILLDQNLQVADDRYLGLLPENTIKLVGPRFALLRPEFARARMNPPLKADRCIARIFVYFGGVDLSGLTLRSLNAIEAIGRNETEVDVVVGAANPHSGDIAEWCQGRDWVNLHNGHNDMAQLMASADLAVGAGGSTSWERCCLGLPSIVVALADNQKPGGEAMGRAGAAIYLGDCKDLMDDDIIGALRLFGQNDALRSHVANVGSALVDGKGTDRVINYLRGAKIKLRPATADDGEQLWQWRNAEENRRYSINPAIIAFPDHQQWFSGVLKSSDQDLLIGEADGDAIGVLRFDHRETAATISVYLVPDRAGRGVGTQLLLAGNRWLAEFRPSAISIKAEILYENKASTRAFAAAGYLPFAGTLRYTPNRVTEKLAAEED